MKKLFLTLCFVGCALSATLPVRAQNQTDVLKTPNGKEVKFTCIKHASIQIEYDGLTAWR